MRFLLSSVVLIAVFFFASCRSQKNIPYNYLENVSDTTGKETIKKHPLLIQKEDQLGIQVYSNATDPAIDAIYNPTLGVDKGGVAGYIVDNKGNIRFPRIGIVHAEGLTRTQLEDTIAAKITDLENPTVIVRFLNFKITVLGDVGRQGTFVVPYEKINIFEALGLAGDITVTGIRDKVKVMRYVNDEVEVGTIDLTSKTVFESPYYNLQQNDVVMVDMKKSKARQADQAIVTQRITFALSIITSAAFIYNIFK